ncbi:MAG: S1C family serine protease [Bacteroidetes bacterium]|jgi:S1-C subfamily serine protease|nr:S1C family serine protease [Bacteroidota bacterium]MDF1868334.1 trypsin-like peptidase domain-containing protein [Saprospiraceae bacterium]
MKQIFFFLAILLFSNPLFSQVSSSPIENVLSSVVTIAIYELDGEDLVFGFGEDQRKAAIAYEEALDLSGSTSSGSGFVIEHNGQLYIVTNAHVIDGASDRPESIGVFSIARKRHAVRLVGGDSFYDIAVLAFEDAESVADFLPIPFSKTVPRLTDKVFAIGNPLGKYPYTITDGIVSGKNRLFQNATTGKYGYLQHTATLIWGNSGGPLVNEKGELIGVNTWIGTKTKGDQQFIFSQLNFAIEADLVKKLVTEIIENDGRVKRNFLGVEFATRKDLYEYDSPPFINNLLEGSPGYDFLKDKVGHYIKEINGETIHTLQDIVRVLEQTNPKESVQFTLQKEAPDHLSGQPSLSIKQIEKIEVQGAELGVDKLEDIAGYFFKTYSDYELTTEAMQIGLSKKADKAKPRIERILKEEAQTSFSMTSGNDRYNLVGSGLLDKWGRGTLYRVRTAKDIGAIIRLCSLEGHLSASVIDENEHVENVRFYLEDEDFNELRVLYY